MDSKRELRAVFDRVVLQSLGPLSLCLAIAFTIFAVLGFVERHPPEVFNLIVGSDIVVAAAFFTLYGLLKLGRVPESWANFVGVAGGVIALANALLAYYLLRDPFYLSYVPMVIVGHAAFLLSVGWFAASVGSCVLLALAFVVPTLPMATILHYSPAWVAAVLLGSVLLVVRRSTVKAADAALRAAREEVAERRRVEARLAQSQRLESVGQLVSGVAHDFNNLLMPIIGYADMALARLGEDEPLRKELLEIRRAGESAAALTAKLLAFSRQQVLQTRVLPVNEVIDGMRGLLARTVREDIALTFDLDPSAGHVRIDPIQMQQVLLNLAANARDAMPEGGELCIATRALDSAPEVGGPSVEIAVTDTGLGMTPEVREHVFEPFFTTKQPEHGTGLGLATAHGIVTQSGGSIAIDSEPGHGARIRIELPRVAEPRAPQDVSAPGPLAPHADARVLLVEDERQVRAVVAAALRSHGYEVVETAGPDEALAVATRERFDILVSDVVMPGMSGVSLMARLRERGVDLPVVFITGYAPRDAVDDRDGLDGAIFVTKPFRAGDLLRAVEVAREGSNLPGELPAGVRA